MLYVVGLGPGDPAALPARTLDLLASGTPVLLRTAIHPVLDVPPLSETLAALPPGTLTPLDDEYETGDSFEDTYAAIVARVLRVYDALGGADLIYAVPGHPLIGESTVALLLEQVKARGIPIRVVGAPSFIDACLEALSASVTGDLHILDALILDPASPTPPPALRSGGPLLLYQVYGREAASNTKLTLMNAGYPDEFAVTVVHAAGIPGIEHVEELPLYELDRSIRLDHLTSVFVPALPASERKPDFDSLVQVMARLRDPEGGCPWDLKQSHNTLRPYVIEEAYEVAEAIDADDPDKLCEELGDLLLQVVFHAQLAREDGVFDSGDVCTAIVEKLIRRHPHVFGIVEVSGADQVLTNWNAIKAAEKGNEKRVSILDGVPKSYPALLMALEVSKRVVKVGFEWPDTGAVLDKVEEEVGELKAELTHATPDRKRIESEIGDLLFTTVNVARRVGIDPEEALRLQIERFGRRFRHIETRASEVGGSIEQLNLEEMESYWREAKEQERQQ